MRSLPRVRAGLLRHPLEDQVLVYDPRDEKVHLLDKTSGSVIELLQEGGWTREGLVAELNDRFKIPADSGVLLLALEELRRVGLIEDEVEPMVDSTRREVIKKIAASGAAVLMIPAIATLTSTAAYAQGSAQLGNGSPCSGSGVCISGLCCNGFCASTCNVAVGGACPNGNFQCATNICCSGVCASQACNSVDNCGTCQTSGECLSGQQCTSGICSNNGNKQPNGASCNGNGNCCSGHCTSKVCTAT
jgi:PqqD family protein of HPr-rel-A system